MKLSARDTELCDQYKRELAEIENAHWEFVMKQYRGDRPAITGHAPHRYTPMKPTFEGFFDWLRENDPKLNRTDAREYLKEEKE